MKYQLPSSWESVTLGDISLITYGKGLPTKNLLPSGYPVFGANSVIGFYDNYLYEDSQLLISCRGAGSGTINFSPPKCFITNNSLIIGFPTEADVLRKTFYYFLQSVNKDGLITGSAQPQVTINNAVELKLNLPPLKEQKRIVTKIEELFSELDNGIASLKTAQEKLKVYRQAVLKHAFEGKLTAQWREENKDKLETPEQLLARIQQEREARYQEQLAEWEKAVAKWEESGKEGKKPGKPKNLTLPQLPNTDGLELPVLPNEWIWVHPEHLMSTEPYSIGIGPFGSNLKVVDYRESGVPLIFVRNITRQNYVDELKFVDIGKAEELYAHQVHPLDLVITKMGDPPGDCDIYPENRPKAVLTADCLKFRLLDEFVDRYFYKYCINSNLIKKQLGLITKGVAQKKISVDRFKTIALPFPTLDEQIAISSVLSKIFECVDKTEQELLEQQAKLEILRQSILKKAFSGQLVPQDPRDEPASKLLARIQAEKAAVQEQANPAPMKRGRKAKEAANG